MGHWVRWYHQNLLIMAVNGTGYTACPLYPGVYIHVNLPPIIIIIIHKPRSRSLEPALLFSNIFAMSSGWAPAPLPPCLCGVVVLYTARILRPRAFGVVAKPPFSQCPDDGADEGRGDGYAGACPCGELRLSW